MLFSGVIYALVTLNSRISLGRRRRRMRTAQASVVLTLFLMFGMFPMLSIISAAVSVSVAYRIASY